MKLRIIFAGTPDIAVLLLRALSADDRFEIPLVITQQDRPAGRYLELRMSPIKAEAAVSGIEVLQPENINSEESLKLLKSKKPDLILSFAFGQIFKAPILNLPKLGCLNVHTSLLPKYRGASPIQSALLDGDSVTGISLMKMEEKMDTGPVYDRFSITIDPEDDAISLSMKLADLAAKKIPDALMNLGKAEVQNESQSSYCKKIVKEDGKINWHEAAPVIFNKIRAFHGWPGTYTIFKNKRLKIVKVRLQKQEETKAGQVISKNEKVLVGTAMGCIELVDVQPEGKGIQTIRDFLNGNQDFVGSQL